MEKMLFESVIQPIERHAQTTPLKVAVSFSEQYLTYKELNNKANQLAYYLKIRSGDRVGILLERSLTMIIAILAVLKAGGTYTILDPKYPKTRLAFILEDAHVQLLLIDTDTMAVIKDSIIQKSFRFLDLSDERYFSDYHDIKKFDHPIIAENIASLIYTSGTTGVPKGVLISHSNLYFYAQMLQKTLQIKPQDRYLHTASFAFSSSHRQLLLPLVHGATVVIANDEERVNACALLELIRKEQVTIIDLVPTLWRSCLNFFDSLALQSRAKFLQDNHLRLLLSASEVLLSDIPYGWYRYLKQKVQFINMFGTTETTGIFTTYSIPKNINLKLQVVPIGQPISNTQIYILDTNLQPVSPENVGMLYVHSSCVADGYINQADLTNSRFITYPIVGVGHVRLYKTGDLCRYDKAGNIEYVGREDQQLKIRGFRIDPKEIELILNKHPEINEIAVIERELATEKCLVAFFVAHKDSAISHTTLRSYAAKHLPDYMIPHYFIQLEALPLSLHGKVDRRALLTYDFIIDSVEHFAVKPRNQMEIVLVEIWERRLNKKNIGIFDNFFTLGGDSLSGARVVHEVNSQFSINLTLAMLFANPTIANLSEHINILELENLKSNPIREAGTL